MIGCLFAEDFVVRRRERRDYPPKEVPQESFRADRVECSIDIEVQFTKVVLRAEPRYRIRRSITVERPGVSLGECRCVSPEMGFRRHPDGLELGRHPLDECRPRARHPGYQESEFGRGFAIGHGAKGRVGGGNEDRMLNGAVLCSAKPWSRTLSVLARATREPVSI